MRKKLIIATVVQLATEAMFTHHYYGFAGSKFQQREGGPIGLRGTCSIARLVMQMFDVKWEDILRVAGLVMKLYVRYMDDGRSFLQPIKRGWRWSEGGLIYCKKWEIEDKDVTPLEITTRILEKSMRGVESYLEFTVENGQDFGDG